MSKHPADNPPSYAEAIGTSHSSQSTGMFQQTISVPATFDNATGQTVYQPIQTAQPPPMMQPYPGPMPSGSSGYPYPHPHAPSAPPEAPKIMPTYGSIDTHTTVITTEPQIIVVGGCPVCRIGVLEDDFTCCGICCAIFFFPVGILCCLAMRQKRCSNCGAEF